MSVEQTKREIQEMWDEFESRYVLTTPDGRHFAFRTKKAAQKFKGTVVRAKVQRRVFVGVRPGRPAPVQLRGSRWYPASAKTVAKRAASEKEQRAALRAALKGAK